LAACITEEGEKLTRRCGSPGFIAPELLDDKGYDCMADVFSAGSIMYMLLSGRLTFRGNGVNEILQLNKECKVEYPTQQWSKISHEARDLVSQLLEKDPDHRIKPNEALQHAWFKKFEHDQADIIIAEVLPILENKFEDTNIVNIGRENNHGLQSTTPIMAGRKVGLA
jgi:serine/threonine protein kinase